MSDFGTQSWLIGALKGLWGRLAPVEQGRLQVKGLQQPVELLTDRFGVPHLFADNLEDLYFAQGYVVARERTWQLELMRRMSCGQLSEIFGPVTLAADRFFRIIGLARLAAAAYDDQPDDVKAALQSYAAGVNQAFARVRPAEFRLLGIDPRPWSALDGLLFSKLIAFDMSLNWQNELMRARLLQKLGPERSARFHFENPEHTPTTLGGEAVSLLEGLEQFLRSAEPYVDFGVGRWAGSNAWAVSGQHTRSGRPLLASDPHVLVRLPSTWFEVHLHCPGFEVYGASLPGVPGIILGQNRQLAWGITNGYVDCADLVIEQLKEREVRTPNGWQPWQTREEHIAVKGSSVHHESVVITANGPLLHRHDTRGLALRWTGWDRPDASLTAFLRLNQACDVAQGRRALAQMRAPALNFVLADTVGNIGYQLAGVVPVRERGTGLLPVPGWESGWGWSSTLAFEELPFCENPASGRVVSANHSMVDAGYPHFLGHDFVGFFRAQRIDEQLSAGSDFVAQDFVRLQCDLQCLPGRRFALAATRVGEGWIPADPLVRTAWEQLTGWNGWAGPESVGACVYQVVVLHACRLAFGPELGTELLEEWMGWSQAPTAGMAAQGGRYTGFLLEALERDEGGAWKTVLRQAVTEAVAELRERLGDEVGTWSWGRLHRFQLEHPFGTGGSGRVAGWFAEFFNGPDLPLGGDTDTVFQSAVTPHRPYRVQCWAPSWRFVADLADPNRSASVLPSGQSGWPGSPHYLDQLELWYGGQLHPCLMGRAELEQARPQRFVLSP
jgi:penicillin amidase